MELLAGQRRILGHLGYDLGSPIHLPNLSFLHLCISHKHYSSHVVVVVLFGFDCDCDAFMMFLLDMWTLFMIELILITCFGSCL